MTAKWGRITAGEIATTIEGALISGSGSTVFAGLSTDSRQIEAGYLFWALKGERYDGQDFAEKAVKGGATGVVVREQGGLPGVHAEDLTVIWPSREARERPRQKR